jgi:hypothetical protein
MCRLPDYLWIASVTTLVRQGCASGIADCDTPAHLTRHEKCGAMMCVARGPGLGLVSVAAFPLVHSVNGFRLHQMAMYLECQTQFGDVPWPREGSAGVFLDSAQAVADGVRVADKHLSRTAH